MATTATPASTKVRTISVSGITAADYHLSRVAHSGKQRADDPGKRHEQAKTGDYHAR